MNKHLNLMTQTKKSQETSLISHYSQQEFKDGIQ